jgi:hypothetical protein
LSGDADGSEERRRRLRTLYIAAGFILMAALVVLTGFLVFETQRLWPMQYREPFEMPDPARLIEGVDKPVGMLFSLTLGLFVLVGFVLRGLDPARRRRTFIVIACAGFLLGSMLSIYMAFLARNVALYFTAFRTEGAISLAGTFISLQLLGVTISALAAVLLLADYLNGRNTGEVPAAAERVQTGVAPAEERERPRTRAPRQRRSANPG